MTLSQLYDHIAPQLPTSIARNLKTAVKVLAQALGYKDPAQCPQDALLHPLPDLYHLVEAHLVAQGKSALTIRNTKNYLSRMFRLPAAAPLLQALPPKLTPHFGSRALAHRPGGKHSLRTGRNLPFRQWPPPLQKAFHAFEHWATAPLVKGRDAKWQKRPTTVGKYRTLMESYFGYLYHVRHIRQPYFDQLFDFTLVNAYVHWHINKIRGQPTRRIKHFIQCLLALSRQYRPLPAFHTQLKSLTLRIPNPQVHYDKADAWVPTADIAAIGRNIWPSKPPEALRSDGTRTAAKAGLSLLFQLWVFIPYRSRNIREMALKTNLRNPTGKWRITFTGNQLKIAVKRGQPNVFDLPFPEALVPTLEQYLATWRPILEQKGRWQFANVFLNSAGQPYDEGHLRWATQKIAYQYTGKFWHPHIHRTVWATEWIRDKNPGDFYGAAIMLNDSLKTVIDRYAHLLSEGVAEKVYDRLDQGVHP